MKDISSKQVETSTTVAASPVIESKVHSSVWVRVLCIFLSVLCIVLAVIGIILPGIPTIDFLLLAAFFASKGSTRLHRWLHQHRIFGPMLREWGNVRTIPRKRKVLITISMSIAAVIIYFSSLHLHLRICLMVVLALVLIWIWRRPEQAS
ncbi:hypothetical protein BFG52_00740 [Acinetobacter larvae]|uniref:DUF454 domain-containing protein n=2 Tax=Acinetobacter larvae TaxID=1789224 RepID=A0A1B2M3L7_9GAMM|nr:hypothetical protein BFG52_00740 [Acinetobacter larvae]